MKRLFWMAFWCILGLLISLLAHGAAGQALPAGTESAFASAPDGVKIHYLEAGTRAGPRTSSAATVQGFTLLLVPGWTMPADIWEHQITFFSKGNRVVAMDPRGQGDSDKPHEGYYPAARARDIKAVIEQLKLGPVVLVGWSMGVTEAAAYVEQFGTADLAAIVLVDGVAGLDAAMRAPFLGFAVNYLTDRAKQTAAFIPSMYVKPQPAEYLQRIERAALKTPTDSAVALIVGNFSSDYRPALAKIDKPTLFIAAGDEASNPWVARYRTMMEKTPGARFEMLSGTGHAAFADDPARFNALLEDFLRSIPR